MKSIRIIIFTLVAVLAFADASAKTVSWAISPKYDELKRYHYDIFVFQQNGKWGLVKPGNVEILPASYDFILPFVNGYALAGNFDGNRYLLEVIVNEDGSVNKILEKLYLPIIDLPKTPQYFSEGKLVVCNSLNKYGYIDVNGQITIKCQYDNALPFKNGWAPIKKGNYYSYINETYNINPSRNILVVDFHDGDITHASCFYNGSAAIAYNNDFALIGSNGRKIKKLNKNEYLQTYKINNAAPKGSDGFQTSKTFAEYSENGYYGLKQGDEIVAKPQFNAFPFQYSDGYIIADKNNRQGLLSVIDGNYSFDIKSTAGSKSELEVDRKGNVEGVNLSVSTPSCRNSLKLLVDCGNGVMQDLTSQLSSNSSSESVSFTPILSANAENCVIKATLENDGILVAETSNNFSVSYPIKLRVSQPGPDTIQANESDIAVFSSTVYNDSNKPVEVTAKWSTGGQEIRTIPAHGKSVFSSSIRVNENHTRTVSITLSTGESNSRSIYFKTYF